MIIINKIRNLLYIWLAKSSPVMRTNRAMLINDLKKLGTPSDDIERAYFQFILYKKYTDTLLYMINEILFAAGLPLLWCYILLKSNQKHIQERKKIVYYKISDNLGILPPELNLQKDIAIVSMGKGFMYDKQITNILKRIIKRGYVYPTFCFKVLFNLANYSYIINRYIPQNIVTSYEASFTSAILTYYCQQHRICHINIMHGEKVFSPYQMYAKFHVIYVWDAYYAELFKESNMSASKYILYNPWKYVQMPMPNNNRKVDICFYLNIDNHKNTKALVNTLHVLNKRYSIRLRLHPAQSSSKYMHYLLQDYEIESSYDVNILQSIADTNYVVARYSTVLFQAYCMGKQVIIDDITSPQEFKKLSDLGYVMLQKKHILLSEIVNAEIGSCTL